jgi:hypothetical protein
MGHSRIYIPRDGEGPYGQIGPDLGVEGLLGGPAVRAIIGSGTVPYYPYYPANYVNGCYQYRPLYGQWGNFLGRHLVDICQ